MNGELKIRTISSKEIVDVTSPVEEFIQRNHFTNGICHLFTLHTTCALTTGEVGEGTDDDLLEVAQKIIPKINFRHGHDPSHAWSHMASSLIGAFLVLPVQKGKLNLGTWQSVLLIELDGPRERNISITLLP
ncbi:hypothetical protein A2773_06240 [Candidatus Gottesmanbacteria bacterium RIFCSPHIGHO2_01_FULL_39_10]|uniref:Secondary thiamine-phosphate synthase enzyme n=1 Tax=Candidatus Gottesmanbacteria bacterium RIFCSPHIGHO2_01_FULL_39_10 TaxID=1798375 RepID=A0A1F5ZMT7_9BACT|nr:MAG: hypothetical protein A2773_06240 [Candidatus Gottesmanbacteria bacterium RIFCSPHIGHO2_01_FULL_39_10]